MAKVNLKMLLVVLSFSAYYCSVLARNPNPCANVAFGSQIFVNDYSYCEAYFWCNGPVAYVAAPCLPNFNFDEDEQACDMSAPCLECPATGVIAVAIRDNDCREYTFCRNGIRDDHITETCSIGLRFNRITGLCDLAGNVLCPGAVPPPPPNRCTDDDGQPITGDIDSDTSCAEFLFCDEGVLGEEIFHCGPDLHFNPTTRNCDLPESLDPPCVDPTPFLKKTSQLTEIPRARHVIPRRSL